MGIKYLPLNERHRELGGKMSAFSGWDMPIHYTSIIEEHIAVRKKAGLFDVSHMGEILISGKEAARILEKVSCNNVASMEIGQVRYNVILNNDGGIIDDVTIYKLSLNEFFIVSNAANFKRVTSYIKDFAGSRVTVENQSQEWHLLSIQGPEAEKILGAHLNCRLPELKYFHFIDILHEKKKLRISRTGYTGEDGFEIYSDVKTGIQLWDDLLMAGKKEGLIPVGLGARDSLRLEAFFPLHGNELNEKWTPVESGIGWIVKEKPDPFFGYEKIMRQKKEGPSHMVCGIILKEKGIPRSNYRLLDINGQFIGNVLSGGYSPMLGTGIGSAFLPLNFIYEGNEILTEIRSKHLKTEIHKGPFVRGGAGKK